MTNTRIEKVSAEHEGDACEGPATITLDCNVQECPGKKPLLRTFFPVSYRLMSQVI